MPLDHRASDRPAIWQGSHPFLAFHDGSSRAEIRAAWQARDSHDGDGPSLALIGSFFAGVTSGPKRWLMIAEDSKENSYVGLSSE